MRPIAVLLSALALAACASTQPRDAAVASDSPATVAGHDNLNAVAWMQTATEWEALSRQAGRAAARQLDAAVEHLELLESMNPDPKAPANALISSTYESAARNQLQWNAIVPAERGNDDPREPLAVIVDVGETVLDNTPYQARQVRDHGPGYDPATWSKWVQERKARPLPGAVEFAKHAADAGVTMFYVTNRDAVDREATIDNLRAVGFPLPHDGATLMVVDESRGWTGDKAIRRREVDRTHRVVLLIGDNLGDFLGGATADNATRAALVAPHESWWGERWFMLPNPAYGSWEGAATKYCKDPVESDPRRCKLAQMRYD
ncbi:MAG TPA: HAD family acid phosphatase [Candidatus Saccharimonadia bacterium]|nr:HAD family acid phosphatase [Candidatus Saccharimonadia bacterium]